MAAYRIRDRLAHAWNAFVGNNQNERYGEYGYGSYSRPDKIKLAVGNERTIISSIMTRIAIDVSTATFQHVRLDDNNRYLDIIDSGLNQCLNVEANIDQTGQSFIQDAVESMCDEGVICLVPIDTTINPNVTGGYDILSLRVAKIVEWFPRHVKVNVYNDRTGQHEELVFPKSKVAIVENPLYPVMNEPNSTLRRLTHKLALLDSLDEQSSAGKLDMIIQLPYVIKTEERKKQAEKRRKEIENQLTSSRYGIAYTDGTERITQLNRPVVNNMMEQIEYLHNMLYSQLGMDQSIFDGTASEEVMANYYSRTIEPIASAFANEMNRKFLTKTARSQRQAIQYYKDPFKYIPVAKIAEIADKFTRNEILSSNEVRQIIGMKISDDPRANELRNKNLSASNDAEYTPVNAPGGRTTDTEKEKEIQNGG